MVDSILSLVDFYNETALRARNAMFVEHPRATINFPLFHDLARGWRLMSSYTLFALVNRTIRLPYEIKITLIKMKSLTRARRTEVKSKHVNRSWNFDKATSFLSCKTRIFEEIRIFIYLVYLIRYVDFSSCNTWHR